MTIVITGGPGSGKTTLINPLKQKGYDCKDEVSREITQSARASGIDQLFLEQPLLFSEMLVLARKKQYDEAKSIREIVFLDRGIPDILAYMHYIGDSYPENFIKVAKNSKYDKVFILMPWKEIYIQDEHRYENYEQAELIFKHLLETYNSFDYLPIEVPKDNVEARIDFILKNL